MVLYLQALRDNCMDYLRVAGLAARVLSGDVLLSGQLDESINTCRCNLEVLDGLLAAGITELKVPEKSG